MSSRSDRCAEVARAGGDAIGRIEENLRLRTARHRTFGVAGVAGGCRGIIRRQCQGTVVGGDSLVDEDRMPRLQGQGGASTTYTDRISYRDVLVGLKGNGCAVRQGGYDRARPDGDVRRRVGGEDGICIVFMVGEKNICNAFTIITVAIRTNRQTVVI